MASCLTEAADVGIGGEGLILGHLITHLHHDVSTCQALLGLHLTQRRGDADLRRDRRDTGVLKFGRWASENEVYMSQNGNCCYWGGWWYQPSNLKLRFSDKLLGDYATPTDPSAKKTFKKKLCSSLQAIDGGDGAGGGCQELVVVALVALRIHLQVDSAH